MRLKTEGILDEPEATAIAGAVLDLEGVLAWAEIGRLPERKASVAEDHVSRCRRPVRYQKAARLDWTSVPCGSAGSPFAKKTRRSLWLRSSTSERPAVISKSKLRCSWASISAKPRESAATSCWCVIPCGAMKPLEKL